MGENHGEVNIGVRPDRARHLWRSSSRPAMFGGVAGERTQYCDLFGIQRRHVELDVKFIFDRHDHFEYAERIDYFTKKKIKIIRYRRWIKPQLLDRPGIFGQEELADLLLSNPIHAG